ncbi:hypothetical protein TIFTF001_020689 [Ficus carica]|uniref:Aminotransferase-like plant mobile domain-containing protein n=1 Tax=Ficus carica TaxID=3494 RepID=A0AA88AUB2_FICCA|nr:hypothetical protein TIFTF001_020689 [Ficus carica]
MVEIPDTIFEEREEELLISATSSGTENPTLRRTAHFLKPCVTQLSGHENELLKPHTYKNTIFSEHKKLPFKIYFKGWRFPLKEWGNWVESLLPKYQSTWKKAGIYEAIMGSVYKIPRDKRLVFGLAEKWSSITNTFVFPWGEATVTLEDVMVLGGFSVLGESVLAQIDDQESVDIHLELIEKLKEAATPGSLNRASGRAWLRFFMGSGSKIEHEAFLSFWLSQHVFPSVNYFVGHFVFPIAIRFAKGIRIALAPAVLASIYHDLRSLNEKLIASAVLKKDDLMDLTLYAPFQLVQLWAWERFPMLGPKPTCFTNGPKPRPARWKSARIVCNVDIRMALESAGETFWWHPYASSADYWLLPKFDLDKELRVSVNQDLDEELETLARCLRVSELVGINCIEQYLPHRVSKQFRMDQDIPSPVGRCNESQSVTWGNYSKPIRDVKLYIPSKHFVAGVTVRYAKWWENSVLSQSDARLPRNTAVRSPRRFNVENKELSLADSTLKVGFLNCHPVEVAGSASIGQEDFVTSRGNHNVAGKVLEPLTDQMTMASKSGLFIGEITENEEYSPADATNEGRFNAMEVEDSAIRGQEGLQQSIGDAVDIEKELELAAAAEPSSDAQHQNMSVSAADDGVAEGIETARPVVDPMTTVSKTALCTEDVNIEAKSLASSSSNGRVVENMVSATHVIDLTNEESEAEIQVSREIPGLKLEARVRRLERIINDLKKTRYPRLIQD